MKVEAMAAIQYPRSSVWPIRRKCPIDRANASSVSRWAMTARRQNGRCRNQGARAAEYSRWRAFRRNVSSTTPGQARPLVT
jgi:hypothetical protein